jgi:hypothetical protein
MWTRRAFPLALALAPLAGCATVLNGSHQTIHVETDPPAATVTALGESHTSPVDLVLPRKEKSIEVVVEKEGYVAKRIPLARKTSANKWLNFLAIPAGAAIGAASYSPTSGWFSLDRSASTAVGAVVGAAVSGLGFVIDASSGAIHRFDPPAIAVRLERTPPVAGSGKQATPE